MTGTGGDEERLVVLMEARVAEFERRMLAAERRGTRTYQQLQNRSRQTTAAMERDMLGASGRINTALASVTGRVGAFGGGLLAGVAAGAITAAFASINMGARAAVASVADMADAAERVGLSAGEFQALQAGLKLSGVEAEQTVKSLEQFADRLADAAKGQGELAARLKEGGVSLYDQSGALRSTMDILRDYADMVQNAPDAITRMGLATDAFGRGGKAMAVALADGREGLDGIMADARRAGLVLDDELVKRAAEIDDKWDVLTMRISTFFKTVVVNAADAVVATNELSGELERVFEEAAAGNTDQLLTGDQLTGLEAVKELAPEAAAQLSFLSAEVGTLKSETGDLAAQLVETAANLRVMGEDAAAARLMEAAGQMQALVAQLDAGEISASEFVVQLADVNAKTTDLATELRSLDDIGFGNLLDRLGSVGTKIGGLIGIAQAAYQAILKLNAPEVDPATLPLAEGSDGSELGAPFTPDPNAPTTRPVRVPQDPDFGMPPLETGGGGGGGGSGSGRLDALIAELQTEREVLDAWYAESLAALEGATEAELAALGGRNEAIERLEAEHMERLRGIREEGQGGILASAQGFFGMMADVAAVGGQRLVRVQRTFAAIEAGINTLRGQSQVLGDPATPWWAKFAAMAKIGIAGASIAAQLGGGGGRGASGGGSAPSGGSAGAPSDGADAAAARAPLRVLVPDFDPAKLYEGGAMSRLFDLWLKEAGSRGIELVAR